MPRHRTSKTLWEVRELAALKKTRDRLNEELLSASESVLSAKARAREAYEAYETAEAELKVAESDLNDVEMEMEIVKKKLLLRPTVNVSSREEMLALLLVHEYGWEGSIRVPQEVSTAERASIHNLAVENRIRMHSGP